MKIKLILWAGAVESSLSRVDKVQKCRRVLVGDELFPNLRRLSYNRNVGRLCLLYRYFKEIVQMNYTP